MPDPVLPNRAVPDSGAFWNETLAGDKIRAWIVDVGNRHLVFAAVTRGPSIRLAREITQIVQSIRFQ